MSGGGMEGGGGTFLSFFHMEIINMQENEARFVLPFGQGNSGQTESYSQMTINFAMQARRLSVRINTNNRNGETIIGLNDDTVYVDSITVGASSTGDFDGGATDVAIATGSLIDWELDMSASTTGGIWGGSAEACEVTV